MHCFVFRSTVVALALCGSLLLLGACGDTTEPTDATVQVQDDTFNPMTATVSTGATVTWNWVGGNDHNVTWVNPAGTSNSPTQATGTFTRNFANAGTFDYFCTVHGTATTGMRGSVAVQ